MWSTSSLRNNPSNILTCTYMPHESSESSSVSFVFVTRLASSGDDYEIGRWVMYYTRITYGIDNYREN